MELTDQIVSIQAMECTKANVATEAKLWFVRNEMLWKQKSRECWLKEGDINSNFFFFMCSPVLFATGNYYQAK
jgi:hypothetical protein